MKKSGQVWSMDIVIAFIIFLTAIIILFVYSINYSGEVEKTYDKLIYDGDIIMENLFLEGYPNDWNSGNVINIGIVSNNKINETKLERFYNFARDDYPKTKYIFKTSYNYYFFLQDNMTINSSEIEGIGEPGINENEINSQDLVKITKFTIYKEKPTIAYLYIWQET